jgi:hypothetical protein
MIYKDGQMVWRQSGELDANTINWFSSRTSLIKRITSHSYPFSDKNCIVFGNTYSKF